MIIPLKYDKDGELQLPTIIMPSHGDVAIRCRCGNMDFAIHGKPETENTVILTELVCVMCRKQHKLDGKSVLDRRGNRTKEPNASQRHYY